MSRSSQPRAQPRTHPQGRCTASLSASFIEWHVEIRLETPLPAYRHDDWSQLVGAFVEVWLNKQCLRSGYVDDAMPDSSALWLAADEFDGRALIAKVEGYEVWVEPAE